MDALDRNFLSDFRAMDFSEQYVNHDESSFYFGGSPPAPPRKVVEDYGNPLSAGSMSLPASETCELLQSTCTLNEMHAPVQEQEQAVQEQEQAANMPRFMDLLQEEDGQIPEKLLQNVQLCGVINSRQQAAVTAAVGAPIQPCGSPEPSCSSQKPLYTSDNEIPIPSFDYGFQPEMHSMDDIESVIGALVKQEPGLVTSTPTPVPAPLLAPLSAPRPAPPCNSRKRKRDDADSLASSPAQPATPPLSAARGNDEQISEAERNRRERRKASNRKAAKKCREKKLKEQNAVIQAKESCMAEMDALRQENARLRQLMSLCSTCYSHVQPQTPTYMPHLVDEPS